MTTPALQPDSHHPFGPSTWPARLQCIAYDPEVDDLDAIPVSTDDEPQEVEHDKDPATRGRLQHLFLAAILNRMSPEEIQKHEAPLLEREREDVRWAAGKIVEIAESHGYTAADIRAELRITMRGPDGWSVLYFGTEDAECGPLQWDYKSGDFRSYFGQHVGYALPKLTEWGKGRVLAFTVFGRWRRVHEHTIDLQTAETVGYGLLRRLENPVKKPTPCEFCGYCRKRLTCEAITGTANHVIALREDWPGDVLRLATAHVSQVVNDPLALGKMRYVWKKYLEPLGAAIEYATKGLADRGIAPAGFKIQTVSQIKSVARVMTAVRALEAAGVPREALESALETSMSALVKAYMASMGVGESKAKAAVEKILIDAKALEFKPGYNKLVAKPDAMDEFAAMMARPVERIEA